MALLILAFSRKGPFRVLSLHVSAIGRNINNAINIMRQEYSETSLIYYNRPHFIMYVSDVRLQILIPTDDSGKAWLVVSRSNVPVEPQCLTLIQTKG